MIDLIGGPGRDRTDDLFHAMEALSQLSYGPTRGAGNYAPPRALSRPDPANTDGQTTGIT